MASQIPICSTNHGCPPPLPISDSDKKRAALAALKDVNTKYNGSSPKIDIANKLKQKINKVATDCFSSDFQKLIAHSDRVEIVLNTRSIDFYYRTVSDDVCELSVKRILCVFYTQFYQ